LADAQALDLEAEYLDQEILRKKNGVVYKVEDFLPGGDYYSVLSNLGGERGQLLGLHRGPFNFVDYPFIVLELGDWILGSGGFFEKVTEEWFYSGNGNSPFWFAGA
ncbi:hypothetical protein, partial [Membranihabitans maritimus]|uniref:hypothetical protein n=1 Tax=Membranihabitans maritimus TaxID=2904244 RepID=UPI001F4250CA